MKHYDVLIATPGNKLEAQYVNSLVLTLAKLDSRQISYKWLNGYSSLVHHARELTASGGEGLNLNPDHKGPVGDSVTYNKIFWIDSDIEWTPKDFLKLYDSNYDIVSGAYLLADGYTTTVHAWGKNGGIDKKEILKMKEPLKIQSSGFGFITMKSGVFESIQRPWFSHEQQAFKKSDGTMIVDSIGEDISWCKKAYEAGLEIYFDPSVLVNHMKTQKITWR